MASDVVIRAERLGKKYIIGHQSERESYTALRDVIARSARSWARSVRDMATGRANVAGDELEEFWALKDVNFEIRRGDVVGVIGRNGAGKSTLLKVLSRITEPSEGRVEIRGRVASLLEVGTGFHPELTGRENIYLNGAILGMSRAEIKQKFDEIVAFAEIDKFLDTPVKRYSSGMYVRLAFAVAAHLEPEILIVDEVLAVGDAEFQKKCLGKMQDVAGHGRTVLFVSHNIGAISKLCGLGIWLDKGQVALFGQIGEVTESYSSKSHAASEFKREVLPGEPATHISSAAVRCDGTFLELQVEIRSRTSRRAILNAHIRDYLGAPVGMASLGGFDPDLQLMVKIGANQYSLLIALPSLAIGSYGVDLDLELPYGTFVDRVSDRLSFELMRQPKAAHGRSLDLRWGAGAVEMRTWLVEERPRFLRSDATASPHP